MFETLAKITRQGSQNYVNMFETLAKITRQGSQNYVNMFETLVKIIRQESQNYDLLWTPKHTESMPYEYRSITEGKATLFRYVAEEDRPSGDLSSIQCFTLDALLTAAGLGPKKMVHLLVLHTMGGEGKILDTLESANIMFLVVRDRGGIDRKDIFYAVDRLNLTLFKDIPEELDNFLFFINKEVEIVKKEKSEEAEL
ncbi:hypothetical protein SK128_012672 [Halocaridina rubra]|uniref:Uncharacterized protein n=1 Tax=Halocaridina rubra TaxID=373956 RepID=A0AAN8WVE9_HALRR